MTTEESDPSHEEWLSCLQQETAHWVDDGLITADQANAIRQRYAAGKHRLPPSTAPASVAGSGRGRWLLSSLGALLVGLGVILFFAYNWSAFPKWAKLAVLLSSVPLTHFAGWLAWRRVTASTRDGLQRATSSVSSWMNGREALHVMGTILFGASIWLIAQIYHMQEHFPQAFLLWGLGALSMAWVLPSVFQGMLAVTLLFAWGVSEIAGFAQSHWQSAALIGITLLPLAWLQRSPTLLGSALIAVLGLLAAILLSSRIDEWLLFFMPVAGVLLLGIASGLRRYAFAGAEALPQLFGTLLYGLYLLILSFTMNARSGRLFDTVAGSTPERILTGLLIACTLVAVVVTTLGVLQHRRSTGNVAAGSSTTTTTTTTTTTSSEHNRSVDWIHWLFITLITGLTLYTVQYSEYDTLFWLGVAANIALAMHAVVLIIQGTRSQQRGRVVLGGVLLVTLAALRFNDLFDSLLMRALVFVLFGAGLFYVGHRLNRDEDDVQATASNPAPASPHPATTETAGSQS